MSHNTPLGAVSIVIEQLRSLRHERRPTLMTFRSLLVYLGQSNYHGILN